LPVTRRFVDELTGAAARHGIAVIAEIKRRSPSKGDLDPGLDPAAVARDYELGGAACLSVLTDAEFFGGGPDDLHVAREATRLPVLRKDFTVSALDVCDARVMGADAVLLIAAALSDTELTSFLQVAADCGLAALVEVHDAAELDRALAAGARFVGVNQRDLRTFEVDHRRALDLAVSMPADVVTVAESGIRDGTDVKRLSDAGYRAVLVGETLLRAPDRRQAVAELAGAGR
jgi:indole-3-glycerol phosphate synthase